MIGNPKYFVLNMIDKPLKAQLRRYATPEKIDELRNMPVDDIVKQIMSDKAGSRAIASVGITQYEIKSIVERCKTAVLAEYKPPVPPKTWYGKFWKWIYG